MLVHRVGYSLRAMNRQMRRVQEKAEKKQEKEKQRTKANRISKRVQKREKRSESKQKNTNTQSSARPAREPGRFARTFTIITAVFIMLQSVLPTDDQASYAIYVALAYYGLFGYFLTLWMKRNKNPQALFVGITGGVMLALGIGVAKQVQPELPADWLFVLYTVPITVLGAFLGQLTYDRAPR